MRGPLPMAVIRWYQWFLVRGSGREDVSTSSAPRPRRYCLGCSLCRRRRLFSTVVCQRRARVRAKAWRFIAERAKKDDIEFNNAALFEVVGSDIEFIGLASAPTQSSMLFGK